MSLLDSLQNETILNLYFLKVLGYQRTLQVPDLWKMDKSRESGTLADKLDEAWDRRRKAAEHWNRHFADGEIPPSFWRRAI